MTQTALITGATGLLGRQVLDAFKRADWNAVGQGFTRASPPSILKANLEVEEEVEGLLDGVRYVFIFLSCLEGDVMPSGATRGEDVRWGTDFHLSVYDIGHR